MAPPDEDDSARGFGSSPKKPFSTSLGEPAPDYLANVKAPPGRGAIVIAVAAACSGHPMATQQVATPCVESSVVKSDAGQVSIPSGWSLGIINDSGVRAIFYVARNKVTIVLTAGPLDDQSDDAVMTAIRASLADLADAELEPLTRTMVDGTATYCASAHRTPGFTGCGAVRPHGTGKELVIAFATNLAMGALDEVGGVSIIQKTLASARDMIEGEPRVPRKAP